MGEMPRVFQDPARRLAPDYPFPMLATYHCHTTFSDGKASPRELLDAAARLGVDELGYSDHFTPAPDGRTFEWAMSDAARLNDYVDAVLTERDRDDVDVDVRLGLEIDWFDDPDHVDRVRTALADHPWDYLIGSVHFVGDFCVDMSATAWSKLSPAEVDDVHRRYWMNIRDLAASGLVDIIGHLDLAKKFGFFPSTEPNDAIDEALDAIAAGDLVVEVNTAGWHKAVQDAYPTLDLLQRCHARGITTTISSDCHQAAHLLRDFHAAAARLRDAGYTHVARFRAGGRRLEPLDDAVRGAPADRLGRGGDDF